MGLVQVLLGLTLIWLSDAKYDLAPRERCVPTAVAYGPCHVCVCHLDGVYYCRAHACKEASVSNPIEEDQRECEQHRTYREDNTFCSCSDQGHWISNNCRERFRTMIPNQILQFQKLKTNIECTPNSTYLLDCNICECGKKGIIELSSCTNRRCIRGRKVDACTYGDYLRTPDEICTCSDINLYIDRLCLKVQDESIQVMDRSNLKSIIDIGKTWKRTKEIYVKACVPGSVIIFNCNRCFCTASGSWGCTMKGCIPPIFSALRTKKNENEFHSLPILEDERGPCEPGKYYRHKCNSCVCSKKRLPICTTMLCLEDVVLDRDAVEKSYLQGPKPLLHPSLEDLPELRDGADCLPGKVYRKECNTCRCGPNNSLMCTKMSCLSKKDMDRVKETVKKQKKIEKQKQEEKERIKAKAHKAKHHHHRWLQELPEGECVPGRLYEKDCRGCYCDINKTAMCVKHKNTCDENFYPDSADAIRPIFSKEEFDALPSLPHIAAKCVPGKAYKVDCNSCVCLINHSLMCDLAMCLSYEDMLRYKAEKSSNKNCTSGQGVASPDECVKCSCSKEGKIKCELIPECLAARDTRRRLHGGNDKKKPKLALHFNDKERCAAGSIYRLHCNRCYCQKDGSMRCTQKTCLTYAQALKIRKHRLYLERHGL